MAQPRLRCEHTASLMHVHAMLQFRAYASKVQGGDYEWTQVVLLYGATMMSNNRRVKDCLLVVVLATDIILPV